MGTEVARVQWATQEVMRCLCQAVKGPGTKVERRRRIDDGGGGEKRGLTGERSLKLFFRSSASIDHDWESEEH
ncbi:hypothetical protein Hypma_003342 [Hypsizygus marmoreus]|uniref:Uncharacterized protein n=1 Tax=Hypsizygus marmoreus TaxID=39966 RepID=A0A369J2G6_HYPMA|nr:hypothetical protein Hypma_003342 [Hypsizygus marmoreus]